MLDCEHRTILRLHTHACRFSARIHPNFYDQERSPSSHPARAVDTGENRPNKAFVFMPLRTNPKDCVSHRKQRTRLFLQVFSYQSLAHSFSLFSWKSFVCYLFPKTYRRYTPPPGQTPQVSRWARGDGPKVARNAA